MNRQSSPDPEAAEQDSSLQTRTNPKRWKPVAPRLLERRAGKESA